VQVGIDSVHLSVAVDPVGVKPDGSLQIPSDVRRAGWYRFGSAPGDSKGAVVVVGHVDSRTQGLGRFAALASVDVGDVVRLRVTSGRTYAYRVVARSLLPKRSLPVNQIFGAGGRPRLSLVTCGGPYIRAKGGYQDNLVVTAVPIGSSP
jgi:sortase (surface protein transpeptidase)